MFALIRLSVLATMALLLLVVSFASPAHAADIGIGVAIADTIRDVLIPIVTAAISALGGWVLVILKNKWNIDIEAQHRDALVTFLQRQASSLVAQGAVKLEGVKISVQNETLAAAANTALMSIPQVMKFFNLTPERIAQMIVDYIPKQPAIAQAAAIAVDTANPATASKPAS